MKKGEKENWQQKERKRLEIIEEAVQAADRIILDGSDGSEEETNFLTGQVASKFLEKTLIPIVNSLRRKDFMGD